MFFFCSSCTNNLFFRERKKRKNLSTCSHYNVSLFVCLFVLCLEILQYLFILIVLVMPSHQPAKPPRYSSTYEDDMYQYRHVIVDKGMVSLIPKNRLMDECEWRALGVKQGAHWEHYLIHKPGKIHLSLI